MLSGAYNEQVVGRVIDLVHMCYTRTVDDTIGQDDVNYLDKIAAEIQRTADPDALPPDDDLPLYRQYAVLLLAKGEEVTAEDVHNAWAAWASDHDPESRNLLPFKELSIRSQRKDDPYVEAIHKVAKRLRFGE
jgi:hypothetical protein